ncbi:hypothetical protein Pmani_001447 [Petrolisthes manimaculis]|uniref:Ionotropic glutamate receptor L-glutamate and glycine-binding domain-containing protein n=1 Tax=Petrolisthes manimaculis TaxID=1843537 RepID=A0AAE1QJZ8_9EUCA|nr:hypothetical protein Pmani_001447 [Petrolisthes manimaculis]
MSAVCHLSQSVSIKNRVRKATVLSSLASLLLQTSVRRDVYIVYDSASTGIQEMVETWFDALVDISIVTYEYTSKRESLKHIITSTTNNTPRYIVLHCTYNNTVDIFNKVRSKSLESLRVRWVVVTREQSLINALSNVLREGTHVSVILCVVVSECNIFTSYVDEDSNVRLTNVAAWRDRNTGGDREEEHQTRKIENEWRENCCRKTREKAWTVFPELTHTYTNLVGRELVVATVNNFPFFNLLYRDGLPPLPHTGIDFNIVQALATTLNFTYRVQEPSDRRWGGPEADGTVSGMIGEVASHRAHFAINEITITRRRETVVDFTQPYYLESTTLVSRAPAELPRAMAVFKPFHLEVWGLLLLVTFLTGPVVFILSRGHNFCVNQYDWSESAGMEETEVDIEGNCDGLVNVGVICFNMFRSVVIQGNRLTARSWSIRMVLFSWYAFCVILYALYAGTLTAYMTKPSYERPIDSLEDLLKAHKDGYVPAVQEGTSMQQVLKVGVTGVCFGY